MPVAGGFTRFRKLQVGYQGSNTSAHLTTAVAATRVVPWRGVPDVNRNATFADVDTGTLNKAVAPYYQRGDFTHSVSGPLAYNDWPILAGGALKANNAPTGGGAAKTWVHQPAATGSPDPLGFFGFQFGDDVGDPAGETPADWFQELGGVVEQLTLTGPDDMGPVQLAANWRFAKVNSTGSTSYPASGTVPTAALSIDSTPNWVYLADCELFINDTAAAIGTTKISDAVHSFELSITNNFDLKAYANGSNTRFQLAGFGRGEQEISLQIQFAKTSDTVGTGSESDDWYFATAVERFVELKFTSPEIITGSTPFSLSIRVPLFWVTRSDGEIGGNTTVTLTGTGIYDSTLGYAIRTSAVNELTSAF